jgi:hypothetical protein
MDTVLPMRTIRYGGGCLRKKILKDCALTKNRLSLLKQNEFYFGCGGFPFIFTIKLRITKDYRTNNNSLCINFYQEFNKLE